MYGCGKFHAALMAFAFVAILAVLYTGISTALITFNKHLMHEDAFPFAIALGMIHMTSSFFCNLVLLRFCPTLYPSLTDPDQKVELDRGLFFGILLPIAVCFAAQLCLSNMAFMHSSVSMLQMMKQSNVVLVYMWSLALSMETFCKKRAVTLLLIFLATGLTIHGEMNFSLMGCTLQGISMFCESMKLTLQSHSLSASGRRLDAFTYVTLVAPMVLAVLCVFAMLSALLWPGRPEALTFPAFEVFYSNGWLLLANGALAFAMQIAHSAFMKHSSAITFILTGVVMKDVMIVSVCTIIFGEELSTQQVVGFSLQLLGVMAWSLLKATAVPTSSPSPLPRGTSGFLAPAEERQILRQKEEELDDEDEEEEQDIETGDDKTSSMLDGYKQYLPRVPTCSSNSTTTPNDSDEEVTDLKERELYEGI